MSAQHRTAANFTAAITSAVEQRGRDWVYPAGDPEWLRDNGQCRYRLRTGEPARLIGQALDNLGLLDQVALEEADGADNLLDRFNFPHAVQVAASAAQEDQDACLTWGIALDSYFAVLAESESEAVA